MEVFDLLIFTEFYVCVFFFFLFSPNPKPEPFLPFLYQTVTVEAVHQFFEELRARKRRRTNAGYQ